ncbi:hypothetical protein As57867_018654, partial [Aphanomyces stellatus]
QSLEMSNLRLEARRSVLHDRQGVSDCMEAVREFGRLFERGYNPASKDWRHTQRQEAFVRDSFVSPTLHFRGKGGAAFLLEIWAMLTTSFGSVYHVVQDVEMVSVDDASDRIQLRAATLSASSPSGRPHGEACGEDDEAGRAHFLDFDATTHRVTRLEFEANVAAALVAQLRSIEDAVEALRGELETENTLAFLQHLTLDES